MKIIKNIDELIITLECDSLNFLENIEQEYVKEVENLKIKKQCPPVKRTISYKLR